MGWQFVVCVVFIVSVLSGCGGAQNNPIAKNFLQGTPLSQAEQEELRQRVHRFYLTPQDPEAMNQVPPKFSLQLGHFVHPNEFLRTNETSKDPLQHQAQLKASGAFQRFYCEEVLKKKFPELECDEPASSSNSIRPRMAAIEANDTVERLGRTWIDSGKVARTLDEIPSLGETAIPLWSDDYWRTQYGQISYRYSEGRGFNSYSSAIKSYSQPAGWIGLMGLGASELARAVSYWSPSEKYDLMMGDESFTLTNQQKASGRPFLVKGDVEPWMGICHGWAPASIMAPRPLKPVTVPGPKGGQVVWYPNDIKALLTLAWASGNTYINFIGGKCNTRNPARHPNGRIIQQECFDTNPATFHLALGNLIGKSKASFIMDATFDYEVWNQPIKSYEFTYFDASDRSRTSKNWRDVAVDYDEAFKRSDRFQNPLTRGIRGERGYDDRGVRKIVGVLASVVYLVETTPPHHGPVPQADNEERVTYVYDLELHDDGGNLIVKGGEWHENLHPDFLWAPRKDTYARTSFDFIDLALASGQLPGADATAAAVAGSAYGYPLCQVVRHLVKESGGKDVVRCPRPRN